MGGGILVLLGLACLTHGVLAQQRPAPRPTKRAAAEPAADTKPEKIDAVVNGQSITRKHLAEQCLERYGESVLESLVNKHLILEACRREKIKITAQDIEDEIDRISKRFSLPKDRWLAMLKEERNITPEQYRRDIIWPTLALKSLAAGKLDVTREDLQREFESEYGDKVQVRMIALSTRAKAEQILKEAKADPAEFGELAKQHSEDPNSAAARGLIPPIRRHLGQPQVEQACFALQPNDISGIVEVAGQFLIFQCEKHLPAAHISPQYRQQAYDRLQERIIDRKLREESTAVFGRLQEQSTVTNVLNDPEKRKQLPDVAATINNVQITIAQLAEECIARHGVSVLESEINYLLLKQALEKQTVNVESNELDAEIARAAESFGYLKSDDTPDVEKWLQDVTEQEGMKVETYIRDAVWPSVALKKLVEKNVTVSADDLEKGFEANYGPRVEVQAIVLSNHRTAQEVWAMARDNKTSAFFGELAAQYSIEPVSRSNMGEVPPIRKYSGQPKVEEEAFRLNDKDPLSAIIAMGDRYIILFHKGRTEPIVTSLDDVRSELTRELREKKMRLAMSQEFDRLKETAQIDNFLAGRTQLASAPAKAQTRPEQPRLDVPPPATEPSAKTATSGNVVRPASQRRTKQ
jgi:parvulin-like peptidyl-prolyl isomerase